MLGRVLEIWYASLVAVTPSTATSAIWRRNPVIRLVRLATAIIELARPSDAPRGAAGIRTGCSGWVTSAASTGPIAAVGGAGGSSSGRGPATRSPPPAAPAVGGRPGRGAGGAPAAAP